MTNCYQSLLVRHFIASEDVLVRRVLDLIGIFVRWIQRLCSVHTIFEHYCKIHNWQVSAFSNFLLVRMMEWTERVQNRAYGWAIHPPVPYPNHYPHSYRSARSRPSWLAARSISAKCPWHRYSLGDSLENVLRRAMWGCHIDQSSWEASECWVNQIIWESYSIATTW